MNSPMRRPMKGSARGPKFGKQTIQRLLGYITHNKFLLVVVLVCIFISVGASVASSLFLRVLIDDYIEPLLIQAQPDFSGLLHAILIMAGIFLLGVAAALVYNQVMVIIAQGVLKKIRDDMFAHMQTLPVKYFDSHSYGDVMSHFTNDTDTLRQMITQGLPQIISSVMTIIVIFFSMLSLSLWLTLVTMLFVFFMVLISRYIVTQSRTFFIKQQQSLGDVNGYIEEMINGQRVIKVFCHEEKAKQSFGVKNETLCVNATEANKYSNILMPIMGNLGYLLYIIIAVAGGALGLQGVTNLRLGPANILTLGMIASFLQLSRSFVMPISQVSQQFASIIMALAGAERIFELMDEPAETDEGYVTLVNAQKQDGQIIESPEYTGAWAWKHPHGDGTLTYTELQGEVRFFDVDFGYNPDQLVLHNISMYAKPGQKVAFVGATGAGKTTITNLINRFYDIADGKIRYDGINIRKIRKDDLRASLGMVLQDVNLFTGTVMENIRYGKLDATDTECIEAAKLANADGFIRMLPQGYNTILTGDGSGLSQGQRQLISIARAAVANPPVMILDEATSSIDTRTEAIVQRGMDALMKGRTVFVIAHRLSTVQNADVIMVLENGCIIERGNHDELINQQGKYYQLYTGAFELE